MQPDASKLQIHTEAVVDKVPFSSSFGQSVDAASEDSPGSGFYLPKSFVKQIPNPYQKKGFLSVVFSIDGVNFYPSILFTYNPGTAPYEALGAGVGWACDANFLYFYFVHYKGVEVNFTVKWALDTIT